MKRFQLADPEMSAAWVQRTRRHPRPTQYDYLHLRYLVEDLAEALATVPAPVKDVLDVFCGARPYDDLLPPGARSVGLDVMEGYGLADIVSEEFLPFPDDSFDLVMCLEAFHFVPDPVAGLAEIRRVLRPGGTVIITVPLVWEYNPTILEHRYTGPELTALVSDWDDVTLKENGGRAVTWATLTGHMLDLVEKRLRRKTVAAALFRPLFVLSYLGINALAAVADRLERRRSPEDPTLPMNLLVSARRPPASS